MKIAIRSQDLAVDGVDNLINMLNAYGLDGLQLVCYKTFGNVAYKQGGLPQSFIPELKRLAKTTDIFLVGAYFNPVHSDKEKVRKGMEIFKGYLELCAALGCNIVGSETGSYNDDIWTYHPENRTEKALIRSAEAFRELCDYAEGCGAYVGIEGAAGHIAYSPDVLSAMIKMIGRQNIQVIFDLYNYLDDNNHSTYLDILQRGLELFKGKIRCFHMKDYTIENGRLKQVAVGKGMFDYSKILHLIKRYDDDAVLVLEGVKGEDIHTAVELIKSLWEK